MKFGLSLKISLTSSLLSSRISTFPSSRLASCVYSSQFDEATEFEKATVELFQDVFGFEARHVGPIGLTPDVLLLSDENGYQAILDNKAYHKYTINNDHYNRMVHNYIGNIINYSKSDKPLAFFSYIAGGFGGSIDKQLRNIADAGNLADPILAVIAPFQSRF